jgi:hypothetical protein
MDTSTQVSEQLYEALNSQLICYTSYENTKDYVVQYTSSKLSSNKSGRKRKRNTLYQIN